VNLVGFYFLAQSFGGITVCMKPWTGPAGPGQNLHDYNSGFNAVLDGYSLKKGGSQYLHLKAPQALAYVRERDNLPNGDLDRTHRQQAVIDYVIWKLKSDGILGDLATANKLLSTATQYIITDADWNLLEFSTNMRALSGKNLSFFTAPIVGYATIAGQAANQIDIPTIQAAIKEKFSAPAGTKKKATAKSKSAKKTAPIPPASSVTVDIYNGAGVANLAGNVSQALVAKGYKAGLVTNASAQSQTVTAGAQVFYGKGASANAEKIAKYFGATAKALTSLTAGHVEVLLGTGSTVVPGSLTQTASGSASSSATAVPTSSGNNGAAGGAVSVAAKAKYGVPCVY
jgi:hypothetical protein